MYFKEFHQAQHSCISKVTSFGPLYQPSQTYIPEPMKETVQLST